MTSVGWCPCVYDGNGDTSFQGYEYSSPATLCSSVSLPLNMDTRSIAWHKEPPQSALSAIHSGYKLDAISILAHGIVNVPVY